MDGKEQRFQDDRDSGRRFSGSQPSSLGTYKTECVRALEVMDSVLLAGLVVIILNSFHLGTSGMETSWV